MRQPDCPSATISEDENNYWTAWYILAKFCIIVHVNIV